MQKRNISIEKGFTLIEVLIVVLIIGVLSAIAVPQYQLAVEKARYMELITVAETIYKAEELYYMEKGQYTRTLSDLDIKLSVPTTLYFSAMITKSDTYISAHNQQSPSLSYIVYLDHHPSQVWRGVRQCRVESNNEILKKVCQSLTGKPVSGSDNYWTAFFR